MEENLFIKLVTDVLTKTASPERVHLLEQVIDGDSNLKDRYLMLVKYWNEGKSQREQKIEQELKNVWRKINESK